MTLPGDQDLAPRLLQLLKPRLHLQAETEALSLDADLARLGLDSMTSIDLLMDIEREFGIVIQDEQITTDFFSTPATILRVIESEVLIQSRS